MLGQIKTDDFIFFFNPHAHKGIDEFVKNPGDYDCETNDDHYIEALYEEQFDIAKKKTIGSGCINGLLRKEPCCD